MRQACARNTCSCSPRSPSCSPPIPCRVAHAGDGCRIGLPASCAGLPPALPSCTALVRAPRVWPSRGAQQTGPWQRRASRFLPTHLLIYLRRRGHGKEARVAFYRLTYLFTYADGAKAKKGESLFYRVRVKDNG